MKTRNLILIVSLLVFASMLLAACQPAAPAAAPVEEAAPAEEAAPVEEAAPAEEGDPTPADLLALYPNLPETLPAHCNIAEVNEGVEFAKKYWVNDLAKSGDWEPVFRFAPERYTVGYIEGLGGFPDSVAMTEGFVAAAKLACVDLVRCDSKYEVEPAINCAQVMKDAGVDAVMNSNWQAPAMEAMAETLKGIPHVTCDVDAPGVTFFGVDNCFIGTTAGTYMAQWVLDNWDGAVADVWVVNPENPDVGELPEKRLSCAEATIKEMLPEIPADHYVRIPGGSFTDEGFEAMTTWLTANPDAKLVLATTINDNGAVGASSACDSAGRDCVVVGKGASGQAWAELDKPEAESTFKASIDFAFFEYARYEIPALFDLIEGKTIPAVLKNNVYVLDRNNMAEHLAVRPAE